MQKKITLYALALLGMMVVFNSCKKEYETIQTIDDAKIQAYFKQNNITMDPDASGYYYKITEPGTGAEVKNADSVYYSYSFESLSGKVYQQTSDLAITGTFLGYTEKFAIDKGLYSILPFREVLSKLKRGGKATLILPSHMAFGKNGLPDFGIPSNEILLVKIGMYTQSKRHEIDDYMINVFKAKNNLTLTKDPSGLYYNVITPGTGTDPISLSSTITVNYTVRYLDGTVLESSTDGKYAQVLEDLYEGWQIALPGRLRAGGKIRLVIPSALGSGSTPLDFDIEVVNVAN